MQPLRLQIACRRGGGGSIGLPARLDTVRSLTPLASAFRLPAALTLRGFSSVSWYDLQRPLCDAVKHDSASTCQFTFTVHAEAAKILGHCLHDLWSSYVNPTGENAPAGRSAVASLAHLLVLLYLVIFAEPWHKGMANPHSLLASVNSSVTSWRAASKSKPLSFQMVE